MLTLEVESAIVSLRSRYKLDREGELADMLGSSKANEVAMALSSYLSPPIVLDYRWSRPRGVGRWGV